MLGILLIVVPLAAQGKIPLYAEKEMFGDLVDNLASSFDVMPLPAQGPLQHAVLVDGYDFSTLGESLASIKTAYAAGLPLVIISPSAEAQSFLDEVTGGDVDLPANLAPRPSVLGEPLLEAIALRRSPGAATADVAEFWVAFDGNDGTAAEEKAEDERMVGSIADWVRETPAPTPPKPPAPRAGARTAQPRMALKATADDKRPAIDDLTTAVVRKVSFQFDQGSMATVVRSWAAYSSAQNEDWYIFELTTTSQPLNFATWSLGGMFNDWEKNDSNCRGILKTGCKRDRYATQVQVQLKPKTAGLELIYYGPDSDRAQDEYSYTSKFSLGGKVTAGYDDKGVKGGVELSGGAEFSRSTKVTIKDATLFGTSNPALDLAGWRFDMPPMRAVNDLTPYGGPSMNCDNLLQMPYPVQRGSMESRQYAIYRLPAGERTRLSGIDLTVSLKLQESSSVLQNWTAKYCNIVNCNCTPDNWVHKNHEFNDRAISFPLAAHPVK